MHETPLFMRVLENPVVRNNAAWEGLKSMEKLRFSTIFLGFCGYLGRKGLFLPVFETRKPLEPTKYGQIHASHSLRWTGLVQSEKNLPFRSSGGSNGRIQCVNHGRKQLEMLHQHLREILSLGRSNRQHGAETPLLAAD